MNFICQDIFLSIIKRITKKKNGWKPGGPPPGIAPTPANLDLLAFMLIFYTTA
jgi:hypothetical protein